MSILELVLSNPWNGVWIVILASVLVRGLVDMVMAVIPDRTHSVKVGWDFGNGKYKRIEIKNPTDAEIDKALEGKEDETVD